MSESIRCRDCGNSLLPDARGCPKCALNLEAERMLDRFVWRRLLPALAILALAVIGAVIYVVR